MILSKTKKALSLSTCRAFTHEEQSNYETKNNTESNDSPMQHEPQPRDFEMSRREVFFVNVIDTLKMFIFLGCGLVVWVLLSAFIAALWSN